MLTGVSYFHPPIIFSILQPFWLFNTPVLIFTHFHTKIFKSF